jgi:hypothetical protein
MKHSFQLGQIFATPGALALLEKHNMNMKHIIARYREGDWGDSEDDDWKANDNAIDPNNTDCYPGRIVASYYIGNTDEIWCITESSREGTTLLLPDEF